jgi:hypothetical protein
VRRFIAAFFSVGKSYSDSNRFAKSGNKLPHSKGGKTAQTVILENPDRADQRPPRTDRLAGSDSGKTQPC